MILYACRNCLLVHTSYVPVLLQRAMADNTSGIFLRRRHYFASLQPSTSYSFLPPYLWTIFSHSHSPGLQPRGLPRSSLGSLRMGIVTAIYWGCVEARCCMGFGNIRGSWNILLLVLSIGPYGKAAGGGGQVIGMDDTITIN